MYFQWLQNEWDTIYRTQELTEWFGLEIVKIRKLLQCLFGEIGVEKLLVPKIKKGSSGSDIELD